MSTDVQHFDSSGTWVKPPGAVRLTVSLKGGDGDNSVGAIPHAVTFTGGGGGVTAPGGGGSGGVGGSGPAMNSSVAGGGGSGGRSAAVDMDLGTVARAPEWNVTPGDGGQLVRLSYNADEVPDRMNIKIGRGGYARIVTELND